VHVLDNPAWYALTGSQHHLGTAHGRAARFDPEVSPFGALGPGSAPSAWSDLAALVGPGGTVTLTGDVPHPPPVWSVVNRIDGLQMWGDGAEGRVGASVGDRMPDDRAHRLMPLTSDDVPEMLELVTRSRPGPFSSRTIEFGGYLGVRHGDRLVAMAGERLRPSGHAEVSAVTTDPEYRHRGLAGRLVLAVAGRIVERGETPFLHVSSANSGAVRLYETLGFTVRRSVRFVVLELDRS
jgi:ribosomal protein S18 acetylase RimI-like enzyme